MNQIILPDGAAFNATYAGEDPGGTIFSASLLTTDIILVVNSFTGADQFIVSNPNTGDHVYIGYSALSELHKWPDCITIILRKEE